ncbi:MAG: hypothetical protein NC453_07375 [Muribaculum sp.]|nr:hypothetical protein [Muribaculum sp.]
MFIAEAENLIDKFETVYAEIYEYHIPALDQETIDRIIDHTKYFQRYIDELPVYVVRYNNLKEQFEKILTTGNIEQAKILYNEIDAFYEEFNEHFQEPYRLVRPYSYCTWWKGYGDFEWKIEDLSVEYRYNCNHMEAYLEEAVSIDSSVATINKELNRHIAECDNTLEIPGFILSNGLPCDENKAQFTVNKIQGTIVDDLVCNTIQKMTLRLPETIKSIQGKVFCTDNISKVFVAAMTPPELDEEAFTNHVYDKAILYIPQIKFAEYVQTNWKRFINIDIYWNSGISSTVLPDAKPFVKDGLIILPDQTTADIFDINGRLIFSKAKGNQPMPQRGIYIVKNRQQLIQANSLTHNSITRIRKQQQRRKPIYPELPSLSFAIDVRQSCRSRFHSLGNRTHTRGLDNRVRI